MQKEQIETQYFGIKAQLDLLMFKQEIEAAGKEYEAPWLKNGGKVMRDDSGRFYSNAPQEDMTVEEATQVMFGNLANQVDNYSSQIKDLPAEQVKRLDEYIDSNEFKSSMEAIRESPLVKSNSAVQKGFDAASDAVKQARKDGILATLKRVPEAIKEAIDYTQHDEGKVFDAAAGALLVGGVIALGAMISPVIPLTLASAAIAAKTASAANILEIGGLAPGLKSIKDHESSWDTIKAFVVGGVGQITFAAAVLASLVGGFILLFDAFKGVTTNFGSGSFSDFDWGKDHSSITLDRFLENIGVIDGQNEA